MFAAKGVYPTLYVVTDFIDTAGYLTSENLQSLHANGYDLQCHSKTHLHLITLTPAQLDAEYEAVNNFFSDLNIPIPEHHAYPFGESDAEIGASVTKYRKTGRVIGNANYINTVVSDKFKIQCAKSMDGHSVSDFLKASIDLAISSNGLVIFYGHGVYVTDPSESTYSNPTKLSAISEAIDYAIANGVAIKTISQVYEDYI